MTPITPFSDSETVNDSNNSKTEKPLQSSIISTSSDLSKKSSQSLQSSLSSTGATINTTANQMSGISATSQATPIADYSNVKGVKRLFNKGIHLNKFLFTYLINLIIIKGTPAPDYTKVEALKRTFLRGTPKANYTNVSAVKRILRKGMDFKFLKKIFHIYVKLN
jgi:hypothetical protein